MEGFILNKLKKKKSQHSAVFDFAVVFLPSLVKWKALTA